MTRWGRWQVRHKRDQRIANLIDSYGGSKIGPIYVRWQWCDPLHSAEPHLFEWKGRGFEFEVICGGWEIRIGWSQISIWHGVVPLINWCRKYRPKTTTSAQAKNEHE